MDTRHHCWSVPLCGPSGFGVLNMYCNKFVLVSSVLVVLIKYFAVCIGVSFDRQNLHSKGFTGFI